MQKKKKRNDKSKTGKSRAVRVPEGKPPLVPQYRKSDSEEVTAGFKAGKDLEA